MLFTLLLSAALILASKPAMAEVINVAVASNFAPTIRALVKPFEAKADCAVILSFGSTGKHYAQIKNGAPFDAFFAADAQRPQRLEAAGLIVPGSRFTYAVGRLVLWSPQAEYVDPEGKVLERDDFRYLAIANPKLAPYGRAAQEVLQGRGLWQALSRRIARGENIAQAFGFIKSGNAQLGFVAYAQIKNPKQPLTGSFWQVPQTLYTPIRQQAVLLNNKEGARAFLSFVQSEEAKQAIRAYGYDIP